MYPFRRRYENIQIGERVEFGTPDNRSRVGTVHYRDQRGRIFAETERGRSYPVPRKYYFHTLFDTEDEVVVAALVDQG
jgi:hypothetical protein